MKAKDNFFAEIINTDGLQGLRRYGVKLVSGGIGAHMFWTGRLEENTFDVCNSQAGNICLSHNAIEMLLNSKAVVTCS